MPKMLHYFAVLTVALSACFGSCHAVDENEALYNAVQSDAPSRLRTQADRIPMASVLSTPNVVCKKDESSVYFFAYFKGFYTITCFEGEYYGYQLFLDENDEAFAISDKFHFETIESEEMMVHEYEDATVYTGKAVQIIRFE